MNSYYRYQYTLRHEGGAVGESVACFPACASRKEVFGRLSRRHGAGVKVYRRSIKKISRQEYEMYYF